MCEIITDLVFPTIYTIIGAGIGGYVAFRIAKQGFSHSKKDEAELLCARIDVFLSEINDQCMKILDCIQCIYDPTMQDRSFMAELEKSYTDLKGQIGSLDEYWRNDCGTIFLVASIGSLKRKPNKCRVHKEQMPGIIEKAKAYSTDAAKVHSYIMKHTKAKDSPEFMTDTQLRENMKNGGEIAQNIADVSIRLNMLYDSCAKLLKAVHWEQL